MKSLDVGKSYSMHRDVDGLIAKLEVYGRLFAESLVSAMI
jgi:hypothetical protein